MDILCKHCGEPVDADEFHEAERGTWRAWVAAFQRYGCGAVDALFDGGAPGDSVKCNAAPVLSPEALEAVELIGEMLGDDIDGAACMMADHVTGGDW